MMPLKDQGLVEPEEERHQWVFHVAVSGRYSDLRESKTLASEQHEDELRRRKRAATLRRSLSESRPATCISQP